MKKSILFALLLLGLKLVNAQFITDKLKHTPGALPYAPTAGSKYIDPVFKTEVLRVTDSTYMNQFGWNNQAWTHNYATVPAFNANNTVLWMHGGGGQYLIDFDTCTFMTSNLRPLAPQAEMWEPKTPKHVSVSNNFYWSEVDPKIMYCHNDTAIWAYNIDTRLYTKVIDIYTEVRALGDVFDYDLTQLTVSNNDSNFAMNYKDQAKWWRNAGIINWSKKYGFRRMLDTTVDAAASDDSGRYLLLATYVTHPNDTNAIVVDLATNTTQYLLNWPHETGGHGDVGYGNLLGRSVYNRYVYRDLSNPKVVSTMMQCTSWFDDHMSFREKDNKRVTISTYDTSPTGNTVPYGDSIFYSEIFQLATDGSEDVRRLAHTYGNTKGNANYWAQPHAVISKNGKWIVFTSNFGKDVLDPNRFDGLSRTDVFILKVPCAGFRVTSNISTTGTCSTTKGNVALELPCEKVSSYDYNWGAGSINTTAPQYTINNLNPGSYTVTVTDAQWGCTTTQAININSTAPFTINNTVVTDERCGKNNGSINVSVNPAATYNYNWSGGASAQTNANPTNLASGTYTLTVTDANNCTITQAFTVVATTNNINIANLQNTNPLCNDGLGSTMLTVSGSTTNTYTYSWTDGSNAYSTIGNSTTQQLNNLAATNYTVTVIDGTCTATSTFSIVAPTKIIAGTITPTAAVCGQNNGSAIALTATGGTGALQYKWNNPSGSTGLTANQLLAGQYTLTITDDNNCTVTTTTTINNIPGVTISTVTKNNPLCNGGTGSATITIANGVSGNYTYSWAVGQSTISNSTTQQLNNLTAGTYTVTIIDDGCNTTATVVISEPAALAINLAPTHPSCNLDNGMLTTIITGGTANYNLVWLSSLGYTSTAINAGLSILNNLQAATYSVTATDINGCSIASSLTIVNSGKPNATISSLLTNIEEGNSTLLVGGGGISYKWDPQNSLSCYTCASPIAKPSLTTTYTLIVTDQFGCTDSSDITINVSKGCSNDQDVFIPNVFSPNGDGQNDILFINGTGLANIYWNIYDRWGNQVFETQNLATGWDGTVNGNTVSAGTYVYYLKATCKKTQQEVIMKGNVSVLK